jgi:hypothetical protein
MSNGDEAGIRPPAPDVIFQQSLALNDEVAADWDSMRRQIVSASQLEAAYRTAHSELATLNVQVSEDDARQMVDLYNATVADGRYLKELTTDPAKVARELARPLSAAGEAGLKQLGELRAVSLARDDAVIPLVGAVAVVGIVVIGITLIVDPHVREPVVVDSSGTLKW